jgi:hypothetical protein
VSDFLGRDRSEEKAEKAAVHFGLASYMIQRHVDLNIMEVA